MKYLFLAALGGGCGAMARLFLYRLLPLYTFPVTTLLINTSGSFFSALCTMIIIHYFPAWEESLRALFLVGLFGGFTSFSLFSFDALSLWYKGEALLLCLYLFLSVGLGVLAAFFGAAIGKKIF